MCFYSSVQDLRDQIMELKNNEKKINQISKNGKRRYFEIFNNKIVSDYILSNTLNVNPKHKQVWK